MNQIIKFQKEVEEWGLANFGNQSYFFPFVGIFEEFGEAALAKTGDEFVDGLADMVIYMADFCNRFEPKLSLLEICSRSELVDRKINSSKLYYSAQRRMCHALLKHVQGIRSNENHLRELRDGMAELLTCAAMLRNKLSIAGFIVQEVLPVWGKVRQRDWKINPENGVRSNEEEEE